MTATPPTGGVSAGATQDPQSLAGAINAREESMEGQMHLFDRLRTQLVENDFVGAGAGIDLGTTKSCAAAAWLDDGEIRCECFPTREPGQPEETFALPSVVALREGKAVVGHAAKRLARTPGFRQHRGSFAETKNEIGLRHTYASAPEGFRNATDIAAHLLGQLVDTTMIEGLADPAHWVITVPASFHGAQRTATLEAARRHAWARREGALTLLDEPYAALLDLMHRRPVSLRPFLRRGQTCLVFDFGGGTCDTALFRFESQDDVVLAPRLLATSRYHRIGGGDIDRAIVHDHLIPGLMRRYGLKRSEVSFKERRRVIEPVLLPVAEQLKLALCRRLRSLGPGNAAVEVVATGDTMIDWKGRELWLSDPTLDRETFEKLLAPFIDRCPGKVPSDEYVERDSVFRPIRQVLSRVGLEPGDVDLVVLAGSSSLIPQVRAAIVQAFAEAAVEDIGDGTDMQAAIARGAALQALALAATGRPLIAPVASSTLSLRTREGLLPLVGAGAPLPAESRQATRVYAPEGRSDRAVDLAIEVLADDGDRVVGRSIWSLAPPVRHGEPLALGWALDENQCLALHIVREEEQDLAFEARFDAPLTHIDQQHAARCRMLEASEAIRNGQIPRAALTATFEQMARDAHTIGQDDRALHFVHCAINHGGANADLLNLRGIVLMSMGDREGAEQSYGECGDSSPALFNLALLLHRQKRHAEALAAIERRLELDPEPAALVLKADILAAMGEAESSRLHYQDAIARTGAPEQESRWSLGWLARCARLLGKQDLAGRYMALYEELEKEEQKGEVPGVLLPSSTKVASKA